MLTRKLAILSLFLGLSIFGFTALRPNLTRNIQVRVQATNTRESSSGTAAVNLLPEQTTAGQNATVAAQLASRSQPADQQSDLGIGGDASDAGLEELIAAAPTVDNATARAIEVYLNQSATLDMPLPEFVTYAILQARLNDTADLKNAIQRTSDAARGLAALVPPSVLKDFQAGAVNNLNAYSAALESVLRQSGNEAVMLSILNGPAYNAVRLEARDLLRTLRALILKNKIVIDSEVLPTIALP